jgi:ethanolamine kinase
LLYRFIQGNVTSPADLRRPEIWRGVARRLAEWHAKLSLSKVFDGSITGLGDAKGPSKIADIPSPNVWTVMRRWTAALPSDTDAEKTRQANLQKELEWLGNELGDAPGIDNRSLIFGHCDLLSGNVIIQPHSTTDPSPHSSSASSPTTTNTSCSEIPTAVVSFIDYEYATPCPAAFDIANHFAEWGGFDCDFSVLPTRSQRRDFLKTYLSAYNSFREREYRDAELDQLFEEVDRFRGAPGFYWGIWALIQATISQIDFDYASYAEVRLGEYWAWKDSLSGKIASEPPLRERRWAEDQ